MKIEIESKEIINKVKLNLFLENEKEVNAFKTILSMADYRIFKNMSEKEHFEVIKLIKELRRQIGIE